MRLGILGGSFDPPHFGHLRMAQEAADQFELNRVLFIPCLHSPFKGEEAKHTAQHRLAMIRLATEDNPCFQVDERELNRPAPSYTIDTLESLREEHPEAKLYLIVGADSYLGLDKWHRAEEIRTLASVVVAPRAGPALELSSGDLLLDAPALAISSSQIRLKWGQYLSVRYLMPDRVIEYIEQEGLYRT